MPLSQVIAVRAHGTAHITPAQRDLARKRLARRARVLLAEIEQSLHGGRLTVDARERELGDVESSVAAAGAQRDGDELAAIQDALGRIESGTYGLCVACGAPLPWLRLDAVPEAMRCVHCEQAREGRAAPPSL